MEPTMSPPLLASTNRERGALVLAGAVLLGLPLVAAGCATESGGDREEPNESTVVDANVLYPHKPVCGEAQPGYAQCFAHVRVDVEGDVVSSAAPTGFGPLDLESAYDVPRGGGAGVTVAIVDAYDDPKA